MLEPRGDLIACEMMILIQTLRYAVVLGLCILTRGVEGIWDKSLMIHRLDASVSDAGELV